MTSFTIDRVVSSQSKITSTTCGIHSRGKKMSNPQKVAEFVDTSGRRFVVIERNGIRFVEELKIVGKPHEQQGSVTGSNGKGIIVIRGNRFNT
jgi:hypothetical protein